MSDKRLIVVQAKDGTRRHGVRVMGDTSGLTLCSRQFSAWLIVPDADIDCKDCLRRGFAP